MGGGFLRSGCHRRVRGRPASQHCGAYRTRPADCAYRDGALTGACLAVASGSSALSGLAVGTIGAIVGAYAGYHARVDLVRALNAPDFTIAIPEDLVALGLGLLLVSRF